MITLQLASQLHVRLPHVYRYLNQEHIDSFFNSGTLRLSSFERFRKYPDEVRGDRGEAAGAITLKGPDGSQFVVVTQASNDSYMLSASLESSEELQREFGANSHFIIKDPVQFCAAVANAIPGCTNCALGFCNYQEIREVRKVVPASPNMGVIDKDGAFTLGGAGWQQSLQEIQRNAIDLVFLKHVRHQTQAEFRFVWQVNSKYFQVHEFADITCKEAVQHCERQEQW